MIKVAEEITSKEWNDNAKRLRGKMKRLATTDDKGRGPREFGDGIYKFRFRYYDKDDECTCLGTEYGWFDTDSDARAYGNDKARKNDCWCDICTVYCEPRY